MAATLSLLLSGRVRPFVARCGFATQRVAGPGPLGREPDPDSDWEPEERELQEVVSFLKRQKSAIRLQKIRRQMEASGPPPRTLTREAMEQIRYLHKEFAESWSIPRLAEGFDVSTDIIRRVLKSKFVPTLEQKLKQDQKVLKKVGLTLSVQQLQGFRHSSQPCSSGHSVSSSLLIPGDKASANNQSLDTTLKVIKSNTPTANPTRRQKGRSEQVHGLGKEHLVPITAASRHQTELQKCHNNEDTRPDSTGLPSVDRLQEMRAEEPEGRTFSSTVKQRGQEFFDSSGNFLYRI